MLKLWWVLTLVGAAIGGVTFFSGMLQARSAPQEAAAAAFAIGWAVLPYVWTRAWEGLTRPDAPGQRSLIPAVFEEKKAPPAAPPGSAAGSAPGASASEHGPADRV